MRKSSLENLNNLPMVIQLVMVESGFLPKPFDPKAWVSSTLEAYIYIGKPKQK